MGVSVCVSVCNEGEGPLSDRGGAVLLTCLLEAGVDDGHELEVAVPEVAPQLLVPQTLREERSRWLVDGSTDGLADWRVCVCAPIPSHQSHSQSV